jgi:hypothetical protein
MGDGDLELAVVRLAEEEEQIYSQRGRIQFPDRFKVVNAHIRVSRLRFPRPGSYDIRLLIDGDLIAQRRIEIKNAGRPHE